MASALALRVLASASRVLASASASRVLASTSASRVLASLTSLENAKTWSYIQNIVFYAKNALMFFIAILWFYLEKLKFGQDFIRKLCISHI